MKNSAKDFIFGDGNTMNHMFRQFSMGAIAMAVMQAASAQVSITNIVPMQIPGTGNRNSCHVQRFATTAASLSVGTAIPFGFGF